jgi:thioredoxin-related protein
MHSVAADSSGTTRGAAPALLRSTVHAHPESPRKLHLSRWILACGFLLFPVVAGALEVARDLARDGAAAVRLGQPMTLFFTQPGCVFCARARAQYIKPLSSDASWKARTVLREIDTGADLIDFRGARISGLDLARQYGIRMFPTVLMVDARGGRLADPVIGFTVPDFYGAYLEQRLETAITRLSNRKEAP